MVTNQIGWGTFFGDAVSGVDWLFLAIGAFSAFGSSPSSVVARRMAPGTGRRRAGAFHAPCWGLTPVTADVQPQQLA